MSKAASLLVFGISIALAPHTCLAASERGHGPKPDPKYPIQVVPVNPSKPQPVPMPDAGKPKTKCTIQNPCKT
jgi:hypothetical protein